MRHTVLKSADGPPRGALWCTWFAAGGVRAAKIMTPDVSAGAASGGRSIDIGGQGWIGAAGAEGSLDQHGLRANWRLEFRDPEAPMYHLPRPWMYKASLPKTKSMSATPFVTLAGSLTIDGATVDVAGWPCTIGHNWGTEHAERWIWLHADAAASQLGAKRPLSGRSAPGYPAPASEGADAVGATGMDGAGEGRTWLDVVIGRVRLGPVTTPWIGNGVLSVDGRRHRLGGLRPGATRVVENDRGVTVALRGSGVDVVAASEIDLSRSVAWTYADPAGHTREVVNSSVACATLTIRLDGRPPLAVTAPVSALELGAPRRAFDVPLQPFSD